MIAALFLCVRNVPETPQKHPFDLSLKRLENACLPPRADGFLMRFGSVWLSKVRPRNAEELPRRLGNV